MPPMPPLKTRTKKNSQLPISRWPPSHSPSSLPSPSLLPLKSPPSLSPSSLLGKILVQALRPFQRLQFPLAFPLALSSSPPRRPFRGRRCTIVWFRADLRLHDNEPLFAANAESISLLPVFLFDPCDFCRSPLGFNRTGPYRACFLIDSVAELRQGLHHSGSDLVVRIGCPEVILSELTRDAGADAYTPTRKCPMMRRAEERVAAAMEAEGVARRRRKWRRRKSREKKGFLVRFIK